MKAIFLCAGFGTRLYPLTENLPKALLPIAGRPLIEFLIQEVERIPELSEIVLVSNGRFYDPFMKWKEKAKISKKVTIINDKTMDNDHRLGAVKDLHLALEKTGRNEDAFVLASDNLFDADFNGFARFAVQKRPSVSIGVYDVKDRILAQKYGLVKTDPSGKITAFFEKPKDPPSTLASTGIYFFPKETFPRLDEYLESNKNPDAPGFYLSWLYDKMDLYAYPFPGTWFDIGDMDSYRKADQYFLEHSKKK